MTVSATRLAALADAAVPGLRPVRVEAIVERVGDRFHVAIVEDDAGRGWIVRLPADAVAAAQQDASAAILPALAGRLPFAVPVPEGFAALPDGRRAMVYPLISGHLIDNTLLPAGPGLAVSIGHALAALHDIDPRLVDEHALPSYDAGECRHRWATDVDRGAQTGLVPAPLLARWERMLDDVSWWRFAPATVHGYLAPTHLLAEFDSDDAASGAVAALLSWEDVKVADPAEDLASFARSAPPEALDTVFRAYAARRGTPPDPHLLARAGLLGELRLLTRLLWANAVHDDAAVEHARGALSRLAALVGDEERAHRRGEPLPVAYEEAPVPQDWYSSAPRPDA